MFFSRVAVALLLGTVSVASFAATHQNKGVSKVFGPDTRECTFFQLSGVVESDPVTPGNPWFAISKTHAGYKELIAILLLARATGMPLTHVTTSGALACDQAEVVGLSF